MVNNTPAAAVGSGGWLEGQAAKPGRKPSRSPSASRALHCCQWRCSALHKSCSRFTVRNHDGRVRMESYYCCFLQDSDELITDHGIYFGGRQETPSRQHAEEP